jgi:hypothetical protein
VLLEPGLKRVTKLSLLPIIAGSSSPAGLPFRAAGLARRLVAAAGLAAVAPPLSLLLFPEPFGAR